jgi:hypothetical protein
MALVNMKLLTLALGALDLVGLSVGQELASTTILTMMSCVGNCPEQTTVTRTPHQIAVSTTIHHNATTTKFPRCTYMAGEYVCPTSAVHLCGADYPHDLTTIITMASPTTSCPSGITLTTGEGTHVECITTSVAPTVSRICTTTYARWVDCDLTATPAPCLPGTCGPACRPDAHCRKDVKFGREASLSSPDLGGRSQRRVAREAVTTSIDYIQCSDGNPISQPSATSTATTSTECNAWSCMDFGGGRTNRFVKKHAAATTSEVKDAVTHCLGPHCPCVGSKCPGWGTFTPPSTATPTSTTSIFHCPPGTCDAACRPEPWCRKEVKFGREAVPIQDLGGRSQRAVAREAFPTSIPCPKCSNSLAKPTTTTAISCPKCFDGMLTSPTLKVGRDAAKTCPHGFTGPECTATTHRPSPRPTTPIVEHDAVYTSNNMGGRSQRRVAREASVTKDVSILPISMPTPCSSGWVGPNCDPHYTKPTTTTPTIPREAVYTSNDMASRSQYGQRGVARDAMPTQDLGGRSQHRFARKASVTFPRPCDHSGGDCFTGTPARPTQDFSILPISMPTSVEMHTMETSKSMDVSILLISMSTRVEMHTIVTVTRRR